jgi:hypothetical protein
VAPPPAATPAPDWLVGDFRGVNQVTGINTELTIRADGTITGLSGAATARATPISYQWVPATGQMRDPSGAYLYDVERTDLGFRTTQVGTTTNVVEYRRVYLPPGTRPDARGVVGETRPALPDERAALLTVINEWKSAWERLDGSAGRIHYPTWDHAAVRAEREKNGIDAVAATIACQTATIRRDQARLTCRVSMRIDYKRQLLSTTRGGRMAVGQKPPSRTQNAAWRLVLFWNGSTWLIESVE